jgi:hypothetical protein
MTRSISVVAAILAAVLVTAALGCTGGDSPAVPAVTGSPAVQARDAGGHALWGLYEITIDPAKEEAEIVPLRGTEFTANVTMFLQPPRSPVHLLSVKLDLAQTDLPNGYVVCDVTIRHPFPGLNYYRGFDVRGICMGDGSIPLNHDSLAEYGGPDDLQVLNADGYARWWNPEEFTPHNTIFGYTKGGSGRQPASKWPISVCD